MRRLVAIALLVGSAASLQAQRVASMRATPQSVSLDSGMAPLQAMPRHIALSLPRASTATVDDGRHGSVWTWVVVGALVGAVVVGSVLEAQASHTQGWTAEYTVPLGTVLGGAGGAAVGALAFRLWGERITSAPPSMTPNAR
jgi:hypothetical protein